MDLGSQIGKNHYEVQESAAPFEATKLFISSEQFGRSNKEPPTSTCFLLSVFTKNPPPPHHLVSS